MGSKISKVKPEPANDSRVPGWQKSYNDRAEEARTHLKPLSTRVTRQHEVARNNDLEQQKQLERKIEAQRNNTIKGGRKSRKSRKSKRTKQ